MEKDYVIVADSTNDLPEGYAEERGVRIVNLLYEIGGETYGKEKKLSSKEFYDRMREGQPTKTAAVNIDDMLECFETIITEGKDILFMCLSEGISSTNSNAFVAANELKEKYPEAKIMVTNSLCASGGQGLFLYHAIKNKEKGMSVEENYNHLESIKMNIVQKFTVDDLKYLMRGGRISKTSATIGTLINIKPLLHVDNEGKLAAEHKIRGRKKALTQLINNMGEAMGSWKDKQEVIIITHSDAEDVDFAVDMIKELYNPEELIIGGITPTIGAHTGPGTIAIFFMGDVR